MRLIQSVPFRGARRHALSVALAMLVVGATAVLLMSQGRAELAESTLERSLALQPASFLPLQRGRTLLALGTVQRRSRQRRSARESLQRALAVFEGIGAATWAAQARAELGRIGGRAASIGDLTPAERRIAELVAEGKTNQEVATALFVAVRTVEAALTSVYRKLEIRSRTELARRFAGPA